MSDTSNTPNDAGEGSTLVADPEPDAETVPVTPTPAGTVESQPVTAAGETGAPVEGGTAPLFQTFAPTALIDELPPKEYIDATPFVYLLSSDRDASHAISAKQMGVFRNYISQRFDGSKTFGEAVSELRLQFIQGRQKDWNIINQIAELSRVATMHELMTEPQQRMVFEAIMPALNSSNPTPHWDPQIQARIDGLAPSTRLKLLDKCIDLETRGQVSQFMKIFENLCGRPTRQQPGGRAAAGTPGAVPVGAGLPGGGVPVGGEEPF